MNKEVKNQESKTAKSNKKYIILALVVILAVIGIMFGNDKEDETTTTTVATTEQATTEPNVTDEQISKAVTEETIIGRIDISTPLVNIDEPKFEVFVDDSNTPEKQAEWMPKFDIQGYVVQKNGNNLTINLKIKNDTSLRISLKGEYQLNENKQVIENWVTYTSVTINGEEILSEPVSVWHNKPFIHIINAKAGETYNIHAEWQKPDTIPEE